MNNRERTIFNGTIIYNMAILADKLDRLCEIQVLLHKDELTEAVGKMRDGVVQGLKEVKEERNKE